jgi:hypothetical protein
MPNRPPRMHLKEPGQLFALCGKRTDRNTTHIQLCTCMQCREVHRQRADAARGRRRRMWAC